MYVPGNGSVIFHLISSLVYPYSLSPGQEAECGLGSLVSVAVKETMSDAIFPVPSVALKVRMCGPGASKSTVEILNSMEKQYGGQTVW